jgi:hypothetical protein
MNNNKYLLISLIILIGILIYNMNKTDFTSSSKKSIIILVRQASRWSTAAQQDKSPLVSLLHANYGAGFLWALKDIATDKEINSAIPELDIKKFTKKIVDIQDMSTKNVTNVCPQFVGEGIDSMLLKLA